MITKNFKIPIYDTTVKVCIAKDLDKAADKLKVKYSGSLNSYEGIAFNLYNNGMFKYGSLIMLKSTNIDIVVHELFHASSDILSDRGVKASFKNDEAQAYLLGYLMEKIYPFVLKNKRHGESSIKRILKSK